MRIFSFLLLLLLSVAVRAAGDETHTLQIFLQKNAINANDISPIDLGKTLTSGTELHDESGDYFAYYVSDNNSLPNYFYWFAREKSQTQWQVRRLNWPEQGEGFGAACEGGSLLGLRHHGDYFYLAGHINPSATCTMVLNRDFNLHSSFCGGVTLALPDNRVIYRQCEVHFAPTHPVHLWLYQANTPLSRAIYPAEKNSRLVPRFERRVAQFCQQCKASDRKDEAALAQRCGDFVVQNGCDPSWREEDSSELFFDAEKDQLSFTIDLSFYPFDDESQAVKSAITYWIAGLSQKQWTIMEIDNAKLPVGSGPSTIVHWSREQLTPYLN